MADAVVKAGTKPDGITPSQTAGPYFAYALTPAGRYAIADLATNDLVTDDAVGERITIAGRTLADVVGAFIGQLREVKQAMEYRDFVTLADVLTYEMTQTSRQWREAIGAMKGVIGA